MHKAGLHTSTKILLNFLLVSQHKELYLSFQEGGVVECPMSLSLNIAVLRQCFVCLSKFTSAGLVCFTVSRSVEMN